MRVAAYIPFPVEPLLMGQLVVLAYSGGLDTSAIVPWLKERYDARGLCYAGDVGQGGGELVGLEGKAIRSGAGGPPRPRAPRGGRGAAPGKETIRSASS